MISFGRAFLQFIRICGIGAALVVLVITVGATHRQVTAQTVITLSDCDNSQWTTGGSYRISASFSAGAGVCFSPTANDITIDGNGKTITTDGSDVIYINQRSGLTIHDLTSNGSITMYGDNANHNTITNYHGGGVTVYNGDYASVTNSTITGYLAFGIGSSTINHETLSNNTIDGSSVDLVEFVGSENPPCSRGDNVITNNTITNRQSGTPTSAWATLRIRCTTHSTVTGNTIRATGTTLGIYLRDNSDYGVYEDNVVWTNTVEPLWIAIGNPDKCCSANNTFRRNTFRADAAQAIGIQDISGGNVFSNNVFWGNSGYIGGTTTGGFGNTFDHNTFYVTGTGNHSLYMFYRDGPPADVYTNNIFDYAGPSAFILDGWDYTRYNGDYNLFTNRSGSVSMYVGASLATWRTASAAVGSADDVHSIEANPLFTNPATGDFTLQATSPARGAGSGGSDIGAFAYASSSCTESWSCGGWSLCVSNTQSRTCTDANACGTTVNRPALTQSCDSTAPTVSMTAPTNGATVAATIAVTATASDAVGVVGVRFKLDGQNLGSEDTTAPYSVNWNTTSATNASHTLTAVARDAAGNTNTSAAVTVTVNNAVSCVEDWTTIPCGDWSACVNSSQSRTCTDANNCGTIASRPPLTQSCSNTDTTAPAAVQNLQAR